MSLENSNVYQIQFNDISFIKNGIVPVRSQSRRNKCYLRISRLTLYTQFFKNCNIIPANEKLLKDPMRWIDRRATHFLCNSQNTKLILVSASTNSEVRPSEYDTKIRNTFVLKCPLIKLIYSLELLTNDPSTVAQIIVI